jgi:HEAT repeat protein
VLVRIMNDSAYKYNYRVRAITALGEIGPGAKSALPLLLESLNDKKAPFRAEMALAAISIDPEAGKPALIWLHDQLTKPGDDTYDIMEQLQSIGPRVKVLLPEVIAMLDSMAPDYRLYAIEALMAIGPDARDSLPKLKEIAAKDMRPNIRQTAADAIRKIEVK